MNKDIFFLVDMGFCISDEHMEKYNIFEIPHYAMIDGKSFVERFEISHEEIYSAMASKKTMATAQPSPGDISQKFKELINKGAKTIYSFHISSKLSGTVQSANIAKELTLEEYPDVEINVVDSYATSIGGELVVLKTIELLESGKSSTEVLEQLDVFKKSININFTINDLNTLVSTGRLKKTQAIIGNLLRVKPILELTDGEIIFKTKVRLRKKAVEYLQQSVKDASLAGNQLDVIIGYIGCYDDAVALKQWIEENCENVNVRVAKEISTVVAVHIGKGGLGVSWVNK